MQKKKIFNKNNYYKLLKLDLKPTTKAILDHLVECCTRHNKSYCYPTQEQIADALNISVSTVQRHIKIIQDIRINNMPILQIRINRKCKKEKYDNNIYHLHFLKLQDVYLKASNNELLQDLVKEYIKMLEEDIEEDIKNKTLREEAIQFTVLKAKDILARLNSLSKQLGLTKRQVLELITKLGDSISKNVVFNIDKYIFTSLKNLKVSMEIEDSLRVVFNSLKLDSTFDEVLNAVN